MVEKQSEESHWAGHRPPWWFGETEAAQSDRDIKKGEGSEWSQSEGCYEGTGDGLLCTLW